MVLGGHKPLKPLVRILYRNCLIRKNGNGNLLQKGAKGQKNQGGADIENSMDICNLSHWIIRSQAYHKVRKRSQDAQGHKQGRTNHIEHQMNQGGALCIAAGSHRSQKRCNTGTDILAEQHEHGTVKVDDAAHSQSLKDTHRRRRGLDNGCEYRSYQDSQKGIGKFGHHMDEGFGIPQRNHGIAHHAHADEQNADTGNNASHMLYLFIFRENQGHNAHKGDERSQCSYVQGNQLSRNGGTYIGTHDNPYSLLKCHKTRVDKSNCHDGCG